EDGLGVTQPRQRPPRLAQPFEVAAWRSGIDLLEQLRQRLDLLDALASFVHVAFVGVISAQPTRAAAELAAGDAFQLALDGPAGFDSKGHAGVYAKSGDRNVSAMSECLQRCNTVELPRIHLAIRFDSHLLVTGAR